MRFGLDRMRRLHDRAGLAAGALRVDPRRGHQRQVLDGAHDRRDPAPPRPAHRHLPVAAPRLLHRARAHRRRGLDARALRRRRRARRAARPRRSTARWRADDRVTQFEALTAAAYDELAGAGVQVAVVEAGPRRALRRDQRHPVARAGADQRRPRAHALAGADGGRHRAREARRRAAGRRSSSSATDLHPDALALARAHVRRARRAAGRGGRAPTRHPRGAGAAARYQRRNFALARAAAEAYLGALDEDAVRRRGRLDARPGPLRGRRHASRTRSSTARTTRAGMAALAEALRGFLDGRRLVACISILDDKDAAGMLRELLPLCDEVDLHRERQPARAAARRRCSRCAASSAARRRAPCATRARRSRRRAPPPGPTASRWPPAPST